MSPVTWLSVLKASYGAQVLPTVCSMQNSFILAYSPFDLKTLSGSALVWLQVKYLVCQSYLVCGSYDFSRLLADFSLGLMFSLLEGRFPLLDEQSFPHGENTHFLIFSEEGGKKKKKRWIIKVLLGPKEREGRASLAWGSKVLGKPAECQRL